MANIEGEITLVGGGTVPAPPDLYALIDEGPGVVWLGVDSVSGKNFGQISGVSGTYKGILNTKKSGESFTPNFMGGAGTYQIVVDDSGKVTLTLDRNGDANPDSDRTYFPPDTQVVSITGFSEEASTDYLTCGQFLWVDRDCTVIFDDVITCRLKAGWNYLRFDKTWKVK
ncbi:hypothetical protein AGMMS50230_13970 [Spirochaetia bacterium]|nr:hypothetical protein AGMMS50230_13970 [Spirochaetia bacterium]